jgi:hypothetical protein
MKTQLNWKKGTFSCTWRIFSGSSSRGTVEYEEENDWLSVIN